MATRAKYLPSQAVLDDTPAAAAMMCLHAPTEESQESYESEGSEGSEGRK
jgi:hypothetical protein